MIIPAELQLIASNTGHLSPELSIGWRVGSYAAGVFNGLDNIRIAARKKDDSILALNYFIKDTGLENNVTISNEEKSWDYIFYSPVDGTTLMITVVPELTQLQPNIRALEKEIKSKSPVILAAYKSAVDNLIKTIINEPIGSFCKIAKHRNRKIHFNADNAEVMINCRKCNALVPRREIWNSNGNIYCTSCAGLEEKWFFWN